MEVANLNSPGQIIITGETGGVEAAVEAARDAGARKVVILNVSGPWHSRLMESAARRLTEAIGECRFEDPRIPVSGRPRGVGVAQALELRLIGEAGAGPEGVAQRLQGQLPADTVT